MTIKPDTSRTGPAASISAGLILLLALLTALDAMAIDMYLPAMPTIAGEFDAGAGRIQQTLSIFLAGLAIGQALYGPLLDRYGRRLPLLAGLVLFVLGSILAAMAGSIESLLAARLLQALGAAGGLVTPRAIVADRCSMSESSRIFSLLMQVMMIAPILAPLIGGYLLGHGGWRFIFWTLAGLGVLGLGWCLLSLPDSLPVERRVPISPGNVLRAYTRQMASPVFLAYTLAGGFILGSLFLYISGSAFVFTRYFTLTPAQFSYLFAANSVGLVLGGQLGNQLLKRGVRPQRTMFLGIALHGLAGLALFVAVATGTAGLWTYVALLALAIAALGLVFGNLTALTMASAGRQAGVASALMGTLHYLLSAVIGYVASLTAQGPALLPLAIALCALAAAMLCLSAARLGTPR
ncbi:multidrug effflux MFS transporter [Stenotrophomonas mori]|uniref:Bcr/CflA family efflux transporter n=1 Tax=Stenotrophomonas mori TaxID=2871096 RepID=A0ABT0SFQ2_9GAMM|nr:multidrug effflux MFS transporter [Stenotrophomonas mori]MCL7713839.1 multidrug effflux MFS transporter [Stenotrophomonas mori]